MPTILLFPSWYTSDLLVEAVNASGFLELQLLGFIEGFAVKAVLPGVLVALWGSGL